MVRERLGPAPGLAIAAIAAVALLMPLYAAAAGEAARIHIYSNGTVAACIEGRVEPGLNAFPAPAPPLPETIVARIDGETVAVIYSNETIYVASDKTAAARITYLVNVTGDGALGFRLLNTTAEIVVDPGVVLLTIPEKLLDARQEDGALVLVAQGPATVRFLPAAAPGQGGGAEATETATATQAPSSTATATSSPTATAPAGGGGAAATTPAAGAGATQTPPPAASPGTTAAGAAGGGARQTQGGQQAGGPYTVVIAAVIVVAAAAVAALMLARRRPGARRGPGEAPALMSRGLDDVDRLILETLERNGGEMLQSQLQRATGLPKTTLWRHVKRLEEWGYIEVRREGKANRLILRRKPGPA